jgi:hypothetical protein
MKQVHPRSSSLFLWETLRDSSEFSDTCEKVYQTASIPQE